VPTKKQICTTAIICTCYILPIIRLKTNTVKTIIAHVCMYGGEIYESPGKYKGVASSVLLATLLMRYILQFDEFFDARVLFLQNLF